MDFKRKSDEELQEKLKEFSKAIEENKEMSSDVGKVKNNFLSLFYLVFTFFINKLIFCIEVQCIKKN